MTSDTDPNHTRDAVARLIDHTLLRADATPAEIARLCDEAAGNGFVAVCVNPAWVSLAVRRLAGTSVTVCTVAGFPLGATTTEVKRVEALDAIANGAREIDVVMNIGALKSGDTALVAREFGVLAEVCHAAGATLKTILEMALLNEDEKATASRLAKDAGADYVKTSTGFGPGGATVADVALMRRVVGPAMGLKAAGGIRTLDALQAMVAAGATRIGTSSGLAILAELGAGR
jgi:deoxyribose-phosphate aldolase